MCGMHVNINSAADGGRERLTLTLSFNRKKKIADGQRQTEEKLLWIFILKILSFLLSALRFPEKLADMSGEVEYGSVGRDGKGKLGIMSWPIVEEIGTKPNFQGGSQREGKANLVLFKNTHIQLPCSLYNLCGKCQLFVISKKGGKKHVLFEPCDCPHADSRS